MNYFRLSIALLAVAGCATPPVRTHIEIRTHLHHDLRSRSTTKFPNACFLKPRSNSADEFITGMAPLIVQEVAHPDQTCHRFGAGDGGQSVVYFDRSTATLNGHTYEQVRYVWWYAGDPPSKQGIRITLDSSGFPCIWEVLTDSSDASLIYVSRSLENAAKTEFGPPLPGRQFAVERDLTQQPNIVVPRLLDDGPVPMGPFVYLENETHDVTTVICRCMPSQADNFVETGYYDLRPLRQSDTPVLPDGSDPGWLAKCLRLPGQF